MIKCTKMLSLKESLLLIFARVCLTKIKSKMGILKFTYEKRGFVKERKFETDKTILSGASLIASLTKSIITSKNGLNHDHKIYAERKSFWKSPRH